MSTVAIPEHAEPLTMGTLRFGIPEDHKTNLPLTVCLQIGPSWYETNVAFRSPSHAHHFIGCLNNTISVLKTETQTDEEDSQIPFVFNSVYEKGDDSHRLIMHFENAIVTTNCIIKVELMEPQIFCRYLNEQLILSDEEQDALIRDSKEYIVGGCTVH